MSEKNLAENKNADQGNDLTPQDDDMDFFDIKDWADESLIAVAPGCKTVGKTTQCPY